MEHIETNYTSKYNIALFSIRSYVKIHKIEIKEFLFKY